jgi:hypothetical protein
VSISVLLIRLTGEGREWISGENTMQNKKVGAIVVKSIASIVMFGTAWHATAQDAKAAYPNMAPLERYLMEDRGAEIALAQSAAPETISRDAEVVR